MRPSPADVAVRELISAFSALDAGVVSERLVRSAAGLVSASYAGFVRVDPLRESARSVCVHAPAGDPLRVRPWLTESGVLKELAASSSPVLLARDPSVGEPGFLATPVPVATLERVFVWVAGRGFDETDEHLLGRFATAAGRALEAASGFEAAVRMLRGVQSFRL
ncbi:hypothetical protein OIE66_15205 [Nonomuraea sp. NBC_01738]|uniref:hypothetical protein n=1 Tax=Nonomuraea sp. NBC_01738 TaxID=2976003 RepID=UPI002E0EA3B7|nr:hypothetical protein OIE66_15205 [Nonomuraea sp. NBC_01738]